MLSSHSESVYLLNASSQKGLFSISFLSLILIFDPNPSTPIGRTVPYFDKVKISLCKGFCLIIKYVFCFNIGDENRIFSISISYKE